MALDQKDFIEESLKANDEKAQALSIADLANPNSDVYKSEQEKRESTLPDAKPKFDKEGYPELITLRTYHGDVADAVRGGGLSMIKVAAKEQERKRPEAISEPETKPESNMHMILAIGASFLFVIGIGAVVFAFITKNQPTVVVQAPVKKDIISADTAVTLDITSLSSREIQNDIEKYITPGKENGSIEKINLTKQESGIATELSATDLLSVIGANIPDVLSRSIIPNQYMLGVWSGINQAEPFLIMRTSSQETAFPGMLQWEKNIAYDLEPIMGPDSITPGNVFVDQTVLNHDARALTKGAQTIFFYTIVGGNTIIVTKSANALSSILDKIRSSLILN